MDKNGKCCNIEVFTINELKLNKTKNKIMNNKEYKYMLPVTGCIEANLFYMSIYSFDSKYEFNINNWIKKDPKNGNLKYYSNNKSMTFSIGQRDCIGKMFAMKEIYSFMANLIINYQFMSNLDSDTLLLIDDEDKTIDIQFEDAIVKHIKHQIPVYVKKRNH